MDSNELSEANESENPTSPGNLPPHHLQGQGFIPHHVMLPFHPSYPPQYALGHPNGLFYPTFFMPSPSFHPPPMMNYNNMPPQTEKAPDLKAIEDYIHSLLKNRTSGEDQEESIIEDHHSSQQTTPQVEQSSQENELVGNMQSLKLKENESLSSPIVVSNQKQRISHHEKKWIKKGETEQGLSGTNLLSTSPSSSSSLFATNVSEGKETVGSTQKRSFHSSHKGGKTYQGKSTNTNKRTNALALPKNLDHITEQMFSIYQNLRPSQSDGSKRLKLLSKLQKIVNNTWPNANPNLYLFGSSANDFGFRSADMDICLVINTDEAGPIGHIVTKLGHLLPRKGMTNIRTLPRARVPIVKFEDPASRLCCDICFNNELAINNTRLIADYAKIDSRFRHLGYIVKYWAKQRQINEPYQGTLSSYAYLLMVINFLQQRKPPVLPCLQQIRDPSDENEVVQVEGFDCYYYTKVDKLKEFGLANKETLGELLAGFFRFYAVDFDWENTVVSPRTGGFFTKTEKQWNRIYDEKTRDYFLFTLEDPFETTHNLGRVVDRDNLKVIKYEFFRAYKLICNNEDLKTICKKFEENETS